MTVPVLLDTDIGSDIDDGIALAYLLVEPRCELRGVTTVSGRPRLRAALVDAVCRAGGQEWNTFCDPTAARIVYRAPVKDHRSLGLNVTTQCTMPSTEVVSRFAAVGGALDVVAAMSEVWATDVELVTFHDPLAAVCVLEPDVCTWRGGRVSVELTSRRFRGATSLDVDSDGSPHRVADTVDPERFFDVLFGACRPT